MAAKHTVNPLRMISKLDELWNEERTPMGAKMDRNRTVYRDKSIVERPVLKDSVDGNMWVYKRIKDVEHARMRKSDPFVTFFPRRFSRSVGDPQGYTVVIVV